MAGLPVPDVLGEAFDEGAFEERKHSRPRVQG